MSTTPQIHFTNNIANQPAFHRPTVFQPQECLIQPADKKLSLSTGMFGVWSQTDQGKEVPTNFKDLEMCAPETQQSMALAVDPAVKDIDEAYVMENRAAVVHFIEENRLRRLLLGARESLKLKFGGKSIKKLSIFIDDEGFETLYCIVYLSGDLQQARHALRAFDRDWWLCHAKRAAGKLNFDFALI